MNNNNEILKNVLRSLFFVGSETANPRRPGAADGVALILVLGVLSLMLLLAVSFAISMRTERLAAGNYADSVRARHLAQVGLVRAMDDICRIMGTNLNYPGGQVYPLWPVTNSYSTNIIIKPYTNTLLRMNMATNASDSATNFIPRALWADAVNADKGDPMNNNGPSNHWVEIWSSNVVSGSLQTNLIGRVGYLIINCSGLLDANYAGGTAITRQYGTNPNEIAVAMLDEIGPGNNNLLGKRDLATPPNIRYESLEELNEYSGDSIPSNFVTYSYFPNGAWSNRPLVSLEGSAADLAGRKTNLIAAFIAAGFSSPQAGILFSNLIDYVDADSVPSNWTTCVEAVPMINEVAVSNVVVSLGGAPEKFQSMAGVAIECWYPFVKSDSATYQIRCTANFIPIGGDANLVPPLSTWTDLPFALSHNGIYVNHHLLSSTQAIGNSVTFRSLITVQLIRPDVTGEQIVDQVTGLVFNTKCDLVNEMVLSDIQALDPRFNVDGDTNLWLYTTNNSLGFKNPITLTYVSSATNSDGDTDMYIANTTNLHSVGELGYLAYAPWTTVKLYGPNLHRIYDVFAIGTNAADTNTLHALHGLINPNSRQVDALAAIFADMPVDQYPGDSGPMVGHLDNMDMAREVVNRLSLDPITNLSDFGRALTNFADLGPITFDNELKRESLFRNACGLMSPRQNLFTILIEAQVASGGSIPRNTARQRAVAIVWRDSYTGEFFVRSFQWLED